MISPFSEVLDNVISNHYTQLGRAFSIVTLNVDRHRGRTQSETSPLSYPSPSGVEIVESRGDLADTNDQMAGRNMRVTVFRIRLPATSYPCSAVYPRVLDCIAQ